MEQEQLLRSFDFGVEDPSHQFQVCVRITYVTVCFTVFNFIDNVGLTASPITHLPFLSNQRTYILLNKQDTVQSDQIKWDVVTHWTKTCSKVSKISNVILLTLNSFFPTGDMVQSEYWNTRENSSSICLSVKVAEVQN